MVKLASFASYCTYNAFYLTFGKPLGFHQDENFGNELNEE